MITFEQVYKELLAEAADFSVTPTDHNRKRKVIEWENKLIKSAFPERGANEAVLGVVGESGGLERHVEQWLELGFKMQNINIVDNQEKAAESLKQKAGAEKDKYGDLSSRISQADIIDKAKEIDNLTHIDFDGVATITKLPEFAEKLAAMKNLKSFVIVVSQRGTTKVDANADKAQAKSLDKGGALYGFDEVNSDEFDYEIIQTANKIWKSFDTLYDQKLIERKDYKDQIKSNFKRAALSVLFSYSKIAEFYKELSKKLNDYEIAYTSYTGKNMPMASFVFLKGSGIISKEEQKQYATNKLTTGMVNDMFAALFRLIDFLAIDSKNYGKNIQEYKLNELLAYMLKRIKNKEYNDEISEYLNKKIGKLKTYITDLLSRQTMLKTQMKNLTDDKYIDLSDYYDDELPVISRFRYFLQKAKLSAHDFVFYTENKTPCDNQDCIIKYIEKGSGSFADFLKKSRPGDTYIFKPKSKKATVSATLSHNDLTYQVKLETEKEDGIVWVTKATKTEESIPVRKRMTVIKQEMQKLSGDNIIDLSEYCNKLPTVQVLRQAMIKADLSASNFVFYAQDSTVCRDQACIVKYVKRGSGSFANFLRTVAQGENAAQGESFVFEKPATMDGIRSQISKHNLTLRMFKFETKNMGGILYATKATINSDANIQSNIHQSTNEPLGNVDRADRADRADREINNSLTAFILNSKIGDSLEINPPMPILHFNSYVGQTRSRGRKGISGEAAEKLGAGMFRFIFNDDGNITKIKKVKEEIDPQASSRGGQILINPNKIKDYTMQNEKFILCSFESFFTKNVFI